MGWWLPPLPACWWRAGVNALLEPLLGGWLACRAPELRGDTLAHQTPAQPARDPLDCTELHNLSHAQFERPEVAGRSCCREEVHGPGSLRLFFFLPERCIEIQIGLEQQDGDGFPRLGKKSLQHIAAAVGSAQWVEYIEGPLLMCISQGPCWANGGWIVRMHIGTVVVHIPLDSFFFFSFVD